MVSKQQVVVYIKSVLLHFKYTKEIKVILSINYDSKGSQIYSGLPLLVVEISQLNFQCLLLQSHNLEEIKVFKKTFKTHIIIVVRILVNKTCVKYIFICSVICQQGILIVDVTAIHIFSKTTFPSRRGTLGNCLDMFKFWLQINTIYSCKSKYYVHLKCTFLSYVCKHSVQYNMPAFLLQQTLFFRANFQVYSNTEWKIQSSFPQVPCSDTFTVSSPQDQHPAPCGMFVHSMNLH